MFDVDSKFDKEVEATKCRKLVVGRLCCVCWRRKDFQEQRTLDKAVNICVKRMQKRLTRLHKD